MSFVGDIFSGITSAIGTVFGIGKTIVGGITGALTDTGIASLVSVISDLTSSLDTVVNGVAGALSGIVDPINNVVSSVSTLTNDIQNKIIAPIVEPIAKTISTVEGLTKTVSDLANEGLAGIAKIPGAISDALKGVANQFAIIQKGTSDANASLVKESLVPGFAAFMGPGLKDVSTSMLNFSSPGTVNPDQLSRITIPVTFGESTNAGPLAEIRKRYENPTHWWEVIFQVLVDVAPLAAAVVGSVGSYIEDGVAQAKFANPTSILDVGTVLNLYRLGIFDTPTASQELQRNGLNTQRSTALLESVLWLPDLDRLVDWLNKGIIDDSAFERSARALGAIGDDIIALKAASAVTLPAVTLLDWLARGLITQTDFDDQLRSQGYSPDRIAQLIKSGTGVPSIGAAIAAKANESAAANGWYSKTYASAASDDVINIGKASRLDPAEVSALWTAHFAAMPLQTAINLFFRGLLPRDRVQVVVEQNGYPPDMTDLLIESQSSLLMPRSIPGLVARGELAAAEGVTRLQEHGYSVADAQLLITDALAAAKAKPKAATSDLTKLTIAELGDAYADGLLNQDQYETYLKSHGLAGEDLTLTVGLKTYAIQRATQKAAGDAIKAEVALGVLTVDQAVQQLHAQGFSQGEIDKLQASFKIEKRKAVKIPDLTLLTRMVKAQLISPTDYLAGVQALGYTAPWDQLIVHLETSSANVTTTAPTAPTDAGATGAAGR